VAAGALGRDDLVVRFIVDGPTLSGDARPVRTRWLSIPDPTAQISFAFVWAARFGRLRVVELLLERQVDPAATDAQRMTALHWAAANGLIDVIDELVRHGAPLEATNMWGGTVLDSTAYFAVYGPVAGVDYGAVLERLIAAGADVGPAAWAASDPRIGPTLRRHSAEAR
jgi:Ankyrin repeats (3 copies)